MKKLLLLVLTTLVLGCTSTPMVNPIPEPEKPKITLDLSFEIAELIKWMNSEFPKIQKQLGVAGAPKIIFYTGLGETVYDADQFYNILGLYSYADKTIHIFWRFSYKNTLLEKSLPLEELKYTFYHEILHWYDHITGAPQAPRDHNEMFDKRMRALGWIK
jgi:hypothetical protein